MAFPFTSAQWKELERQATIYKYILSSLPVPPHLLFPDSSLSSKSTSSFVEPGSGRCKRTDGKKWRCSRDVAPYHKYCDRHLHRGRPRSRKPVEVELHADNNPKRSRFQQTNYDDPKTDLNISTAPRDLGLMFGPEKRWAQPNMGFANEALSVYGSSSVFDQDYVEQNVLHYSNFPDINIELPPACFTDHAYSSNNGTEPVSPSLNLSTGSFSDQEMAAIKDSRWLGIGSSGGPLAEALGSNSASSPITL